LFGKHAIIAPPDIMPCYTPPPGDR